MVEVESVLIARSISTIRGLGCLMSVDIAGRSITTIGGPGRLISISIAVRSISPI